MPVSSIRPVFIIDRFWPLCDGAQRTVGDLAVELHDRGMPVTILSGRHHASWSEKVEFHGMEVYRPAAPPPPLDGIKARLATAAYVRAVTGWLRRNRERYNLIFVSSLKHEAYAAMAAFGRRHGGGRPAVVLRAERPGRDGDCFRQLDAPGGRRIKRLLMKADPSSHLASKSTAS